MGDLISKEQWGLQRRALIGAAAGLGLKALLGENVSASRNASSLLEMQKPTAPIDFDETVIGSVYVVKAGDTLSAIAEANNTTVQAIVDANRTIVDPNLIFPESAFAIPSEPGTKEYQAKLQRNGGVLLKLENKAKTVIDVQVGSEVPLATKIEKWDEPWGLAPVTLRVNDNGEIHDYSGYKTDDEGVLSIKFRPGSEGLFMIQPVVGEVEADRAYIVRGKKKQG